MICRRPTTTLMPGILSEEKAEGVCEGRGKETCEPVQENGTRSVSPATPSSVENGKASWNSSISDSGTFCTHACTVQ